MVRRTDSWLDRAAAFSWRYLLILLAIYVTFQAVVIVKVVAIPLVLALFPTSVLSPLVQWLKGRGWSPLLATWGAILAVIPVLLVVWLILVPGLSDDISELGGQVTEGIDEVRNWLRDGPLQLSETDIETYIDRAVDQARENMTGITSGVLGGATLAFEVLTGLVLALLAAFFYLKDGDRAATALVERVDDPDRVKRGLEAAWTTLSSYIRGLAVVGAIDAAAIGIGLFVVGTPLVVPLALLVFVGAFFPIVGAFLSGMVAVLVTLVNGGPIEALIVLGVVVGVQQLEGNVIYPIVFKRALSLHPLVILVAIAIGGVAFGIVGAFLAVPLTAVAVSVHQAILDDPDGSLVALMSDRVYEGGGSTGDEALHPPDDESETAVDPSES